MKPRSERRFELSKKKTFKLKKSTFWNTRAYQFSTPIVAGDMLYVGVDSGHFYKIDLKRKEHAWIYDTEGGIQAKAAVEGDDVFFGDIRGNFYALSSADGKEKWKIKLDTSIMSAPLVDSTRVYVSTMSGRLYAMDRSTGVESWHTSANENSFGFTVRRSSSPVMVGNQIIMGTPLGTVLSFRADSGSVNWSRQLGDRQAQTSDVNSTALVVGDKIYMNSADGQLFCLKLQSGEIIWNADVGGSTDPILHEGRIFSVGQDTVTSLDPETGDISWTQDLDELGLSSAAGGPHYLAVATTKDKMYILDSETGDIALERYIRKGAYGDPVFVNGDLIVLSNSGRLFTFVIKELPPKKHKAKKHDRADKKSKATSSHKSRK